MLGLLLLVVGQFDFSGSGHRSKTEHLGADLLVWDVVRADVGFKFKPESDSVRVFGANPVDPEPVLGRGSFHDDVYIAPSFAGLSRSQWARLRQIYVQCQGVASICEPEIAKELRLTSSQRAQIERIRRTPFGRGTFDLGFFRRLSGSTVDAKIERHLLLNDAYRQIRITRMTRQIEQDRKYRAVLTSAQSRKLKEMAGAPIKAALYLNGTSLGLPGPGGLQREGAFAVLRRDVADAIGLDAPRIDQIMLDLERLYLQAFREAGEYWWLLKQREKKDTIPQLRTAVFQRYERLAQKAILDSLTRSQRDRWAKLAGPPIVGLKMRNHFG